MQQATNAEHRGQRADVVAVAVTQEEVIGRREDTHRNAGVEHHAELGDLQAGVDAAERDAANPVGPGLYFEQPAAGAIRIVGHTRL